MKIERLYLKAYGVFSDQRLDFAGGPDFHVIYGPNEAGKSTTLRALIGLLFGIEERTADNFIHPHPQLRVGAVLADLPSPLNALAGVPVFCCANKKRRFNRRQAADEPPLLSGGSLLEYCHAIWRLLCCKISRTATNP